MNISSIYIIFGISMLASWLVRWRFKSVMQSISQVGTRSGMTGREIATQMLQAYGINDVQVISTRGMLTDHYNPMKKTVNLSEAVYSQRNVTAAAVAAHECGHAVQHATAYSMLKFRSLIVPAVSISNRFSQWLLLGGIVMLESASAIGRPVMLAGIILFSFAVFFSFITLPVEFDASRRALAWLEKSNITAGEEHELAKKGLRWAAMTYVVAALSSLATLLYYILIFMNRR